MLIRHNTTVCLTAILLLIPAISHTHPQFDLKKYNIRDGMTSGEVNAIIQDNKGFIWLGASNGLSRFDGYEFRNFRSDYKNPEFFTSNTIVDIETDRYDRLWLATEKDISVFDPKDHSVQKITLPKLRNQKINSIKSYDDDLMLIGSVNGLYFYYISSDTLSRFTVPGVPLNDVRDMYIDRQGFVWVSMWKKGLMKIAPKTRTVIDIGELGLPDTLTVTCMLENDRGTMYMATWGDGLICIDRDPASGKTVKRTIKHPEDDPRHTDHNIIYDMALTAAGELWLGTPAGVRKMTATTGGLIETATGIPHSDIKEVRRIFPDRSGNIWFSEYGNGITVASPKDAAITEVDLRDLGLDFSAVTAIHRLSDNEIWLGVIGVGLVRYDPAARKVVAGSSPLDKIHRKSNAIMGFAAIPEDDAVFMATRYNGVYRASVKNGVVDGMKHFDTSSPKRSGFTTCMVRDDLNNMWVGTRSGIVVLRYDARSRNHTIYEPAAVSDVFKRSYVECIYIDSAGRIWVGGDDAGLYCFRYDIENDSLASFSRYTLSSGGINNNRIQAVCEDASGMLWVGTYGGGLSHYNKETDRFDAVGNMALFPSDVIYSITEDEAGRLWLGTAKGIVCYDHGKGDVYTYGTGSGYNNILFIKGAMYCGIGKIIFGGYDGITIIQPQSLLKQGEVSSPAIVDIQLFNKSVTALPPEMRENMVDRMPPYTDKLRLSHNDQSLSITFAAPGYVNSAMNKYAYMLEGIDKEWSNANSSQRTVTYTHLPPGNYTFYVKASNDRGEWNNIPARLYIEMLPPPWATWWAYALYAFAVAAAVFVAVRIFRNRLRLRQALEIEQIERMKSEEVNNAKLMFFTNVSHELFTPITIISTSLEKVMQDDGGNNGPMLHLIKSNLNRLMRLLQQVMEFRKADSANLRLKVSENDVAAFVRRICDENFSMFANSRGMEFVFTANTEKLIGFIDTDKLDKIVYNLLSNAFKYNKKTGGVFVNVDAQVRGDIRFAVISIRDTGYGIEPERMPMLFKRFYEGDYRKFNTKGTGIGLSLTKDLVDLHRGTIEVESAPGEGTTFTVALPISRSAFPEEQIEAHNVGIAAVPAASVREERTEPDKNRHTILLAEDNEEMLLVMESVLSGTYNILTAANGKAAIEVLSENYVDLVITDYVMPEMDGVELTAYIKGNMELSHLPVIMLSARSEAESKMASFGAGVDAYVSKPFEVGLLVAQADSIISNRKRLANIFRKDKELVTDGITNTELDKQFIGRLIGIVEENLSDPDFDISAFVSAMNMSNSTLYRKVKGLTGMSPKEFVRNIRFKTACRLLMEKTINISEVAFMVGFSDPRYFSLSFKKEFGITPRDYINQNKL